ncbi:hypothetical protein Hanom_Chr07g00664001 [Helianthus anomalus]
MGVVLCGYFVFYFLLGTWASFLCATNVGLRFLNPNQPSLFLLSISFSSFSSGYRSYLRWSKADEADSWLFELCCDCQCWVLKRLMKPTCLLCFCLGNGFDLLCTRGQ